MWTFPADYRKHGSCFFAPQNDCPKEFELRKVYKNMCNECVKEEFPERDGTCLDNGSYLLNFAGCSKCKTLDLIKVSNRLSVEENGEEIVTYEHVCKSCDHVIASHEYSFHVEDDEYQIYDMECMLCGRSEDQRSIMPQDPRGPMMLL